MADLADLEQRIAQAFARISAGLDQLPDRADRPSADQAAHIAHLQAQLDTERAARSHAQGGVDPVANHDQAAEVARLQRQVDETDLENQRLHAAIAQLRQDLRLMEEQAEANLAQAAHATQTLQAELGALTQAREAETAEIAKILAALANLVDAEEANPHA
jgi:DNA repair exonuclease SbcCD ATPase subunit